MAENNVIELPPRERTETEREQYKDEYDRWETAQKSWRITFREAKKRVHELRLELERYKEQLDGAPFDILSGDGQPPQSLDGGERKYTVGMVEDLTPVVTGYFDMIDDFASKHGTHRHLDFNAKLFELKMHTTETGFKIGVLAGVILSGAPKETVDRFERGLVYDMKCNPLVVKEISHENAAAKRPNGSAH